MLATLSEPFDAEGWLYEVKWDGYRAVAMMKNGQVDLISRNNKSYNDRYRPIHEALLDWGLDAVVDGEIVALDKRGKPDFNSLQNWKSNAAELIYYVFDLLWINGYDLKMVPLEKRRELLRSLVPAEGPIRFSENFDSTASELLKAAQKMGMEGIIAKRAGSFYYPGERSDDWLKMKTSLRQEVVIGGYTQLDDSPKPFSALLIGVFEEGKFRYAGKVGTGFSIAEQKRLLRMFKPYIRSSNPFEILPETEVPVHFRAHPRGVKVTFLDPELVCEVNFTELTADEILRHPSYKGLREDKPAEAVVRENASPAGHFSLKNTRTMPAQTDKKTAWLDPEAENETRKVNRHELKFTNLDKPYWPEEGISKRDLLDYYHAAAPFMLPYLKNRPMSLHRHPNGYAGGSFYQKDVTGKVPGWVKTLDYRSEEEADIDKEFLVCNSEAELLLMANMGCIEINPWNSTADHPDHPDWCVLDLDPDKDKNTFEQVIEVARAAHELLEKASIRNFCKTSGSTGLHIYIPLAAAYTYEQSTEFARLIATLLQKQLPKLTSIERQPDERKGKIYLDFLQNRHQATVAAPYSVRPKKHATVSMPLDWNEVKPGLKMTDFTLQNALPMMKERDPLFRPVLGKGIDMLAALDRL